MATTSSDSRAQHAMRHARKYLSEHYGAPPDELAAVHGEDSELYVIAVRGGGLAFLRYRPRSQTCHSPRR